MTTERLLHGIRNNIKDHHYESNIDKNRQEECAARHDLHYRETHHPYSDGHETADGAGSAPPLADARQSGVAV